MLSLVTCCNPIVSGSLKGWRSPDRTKGWSEEVLEDDIDPSTVDFDIVDEDDASLIEIGATHETVPHVPPNLFEPMHPLGIGRIKISLSDVMNCFSKLSTDAQYEASKSVIKMEEAMKRYRTSCSREQSERYTTESAQKTPDGKGNGTRKTGGDEKTSFLSSQNWRQPNGRESSEKTTYDMWFLGQGPQTHHMPQKRTLLATSRLYEISRGR